MTTTVRHLAVVLSVLLAAPAAWGATSCFEESCGVSCSPAFPVAISTLVAAAEFPAGMSTPTAFVDPGDRRGRRLIATQQGAILVWDGKAGILPTPFIDLRDDVGGPVLAGGERGLLSLAVEPDYALTGRYYVFYTVPTATWSSSAISARPPTRTSPIPPRPPRSW